MRPEDVRNALYASIQDLSQYKWFFSNAPEKDLTRNRKLSFEKMISAILAFRGGTLDHEMSDLFGLGPTVATSSAFIQQRAKILPEAFESLLHHFTSGIDENKLYHGLRLLAIDGSDDPVRVCFAFFRGALPPLDIDALLLNYLSPI